MLELDRGPVCTLCSGDASVGVHSLDALVYAHVTLSAMNVFELFQVRAHSMVTLPPLAIQLDNLINMEGLVHVF